MIKIRQVMNMNERISTNIITDVRMRRYHMTTVHAGFALGAVQYRRRKEEGRKDCTQIASFAPRISAGLGTGNTVEKLVAVWGRPVAVQMTGRPNPFAVELDSRTEDG